MRAIVQEGSGSPDVLKLRDVERPIVADNEVLVRVRAASVNALDYHLLKNSLGLGKLLGGRGRRVRIPGVDLAGSIEAVGQRVTRFKPGDEVFGTARGAFAEYATARENYVVAKPSALSFAQAAALPVAGLTALQALRDKAHVQPGQRVLVHGAGGGVGTFAVQIAKTFGAHVTAVTGTRNLDVIRSLGADEIIDYTRDDFARRGERFDVVFDVASTRSVRDCLRVLIPKGVLLAVGAPKAGIGALLRHMSALLVMSPIASQRIVIFMARNTSADLIALADLVVAGKIRPAIDREYPLNETAEAMRYASSGQARAKVIINVDA